MLALPGDDASLDGAAALAAHTKAKQSPSIFAKRDIDVVLLMVSLLQSEKRANLLIAEWNEE